MHPRLCPGCPARYAGVCRSPPAVVRPELYRFRSEVGSRVRVAGLHRCRVEGPGEWSLRTSCGGLGSLAGWARSVRRVTTSWGATAVQIVHKKGRTVLGIEHIGSAHDESQLAALLQATQERLHAGQGLLPSCSKGV